MSRASAMRPCHKQLSLACGLLACIASRGAWAEVVPGQYRVTGQRIDVTVESWGEDCGPTPRSYSSRGGRLVDVQGAGESLVVGGQRADQCWSRNPRVARRRASVHPGRWEVVCQTPDDDPRFERGEYVLEQVDEQTLRFREESRYDWRLQGDHCVASVVLTRTYLHEPGETGMGTGSPTATGDSGPRGVGPGAAGARCSGPAGRPTRMEVRPQRARVSPGERVCLRATVRDDRGCPVQTDVTWSRQGRRAEAGDVAGEVTSEGCFTPPAGLTDEGVVTVVASAGELRDVAVVEIRAPDIGDLIAARLEEVGEDQVGAAPVAMPRAGAAEGLGGATATPVPRDRGLLWLVGATLIVAALLAVAAIIVAQRSRRKGVTVEQPRSAPAGVAVASASPPPSMTVARVCPTCQREFGGETYFCPHDATKLVRSSREDVASDTHQSLICPRCRRGYEGTARYCPHDSEELVPYTVWRALQRRERVTPGAGADGMICPKCASRYDHGMAYCGKDGSKLVPIN